ncbi:hypothetical protein C6502_22480 [Candidatus Poribacteria bacterium]|nr:MAG: hypothetical protein C6502_22480 [Candidatus Poribacteria bacterium]
MPDKKFDKPLNPDNYPNLPMFIIEEFARFRTTAQVLDFLENTQKRSILKKVHQSRDELREMMRTMNPHNAKFNRAKWGDLLDECRQEFLAELRTRMAQTAVTTANLLYKMVRNASIQQMRTVEDLHEYVKLLKTFEKLNSDSNDEIAQALNEGILPQSSIEMLQTKTLKTEMLQPGMNGQSETV